jgi:ABC-2 type transport system ATP-binding protein
MYALEMVNVTKNYGKFKALDNLNLKVKKGQIYGFLGKNGAGKTTTLKIITGLIKNYQGSVKIFGEDLNSKNIFKYTGSLVETPSFYSNLTVLENLFLLSQYKNVEKSKIHKVMSYFDLKKYSKVKFSNLSLGNKQRVGLANCLLHDPEIIILDEPTNGLDPEGINEIRNFIKKLSKDFGKTILISSHLLSEIQQIADFLSIIHDGQIKEEIETQKLISKSNSYLLKTNDLHKTSSILNDIKIKNFISENKKISVNSDEESISNIIKILIEKNIKIYEFFKEENYLENHFLKIIRNNSIDL